MWMTDYIRAVKRGFRDQHGFRPTGGTPDDPTFGHMEDGTYLMTIDGKIDRVEVVNGAIRCCNFAVAVPSSSPTPEPPDV